MIKSQLDVKTPHHSVSARSYITSTPETSNVAVFEVCEICAKCFGSILKQYHTHKMNFVLNT